MKPIQLVLAIISLLCIACTRPSGDAILLEDYRPVSIYETPHEKNRKPTFPIIDVHSHAYAENLEDLDLWVKTMDKVGVQKTILLTYQTGAKFDSLIKVYSKYPNRFDLWCGFDFTGYESPGWPERALAELERCYHKGAKGVGELGDKGLGLLYSRPTPAHGMHIDDPRMKPLLAKCGELNMPVNIHIAEPFWMYLPADSTNDGLMNARKWKIDLKIPGMLDHQDLIQTLENAVRDHPQTTFIACHFANCSYNLAILASLLDNYPNLYADISARYGETATIPRYMSEFYRKYQDRLLYGTDMGMEELMYQLTFRILESEDEHFYEIEQFNYHWPLYGFGLDSSILSKLYSENAYKILNL